MNNHYPVAVVVVEVEVEANKPIAHMLKEKDWITIKEAEEKCFAIREITCDKFDIKKYLHLKPGVVECLNDKYTVRKPLSILYGKKCILQLIARPINTWSYIDTNNKSIHRLLWEIDRASFT
jgi:hypothetical protein